LWSAEQPNALDFVFSSGVSRVPFLEGKGGKQRIGAWGNTWYFEVRASNAGCG
jgi:hypothetical protein